MSPSASIEVVLAKNLARAGNKCQVHKAGPQLLVNESEGKIALMHPMKAYGEVEYNSTHS